LAVVNDATGEVVFAAEIEHRGEAVKTALLKRRQIRRSRRARKTRFRKPRFLNRTRPAGWLPPSLESRVANVVTWVARLRRVCPMAAISVETVRFDTQALVDPEISGVEYQRGELFGYEVREYLLAKFARTCVYCGAQGVPLEIEHVVPRSRGGSNRVSNLVTACRPCNVAKGNRTAEEFGFPNVQAQAKRPLRDAAVVNATRNALHRKLVSTSLPVETGSGGRTKFNRVRLGLPKAHWTDAACVGESTPDHLHAAGLVPLVIRATGRGSRQMCRMDRFGFPRTSAKAARTVNGFRTGDVVRAVVPTGKKAGTHVGRVAVRSSGSFNITTASGVVQGVSHRHCVLIHRADGYTYSFQTQSHRKENGNSSRP
jgi:5-methylcytosine-specific restriction endonuclease McrA